MKEQGSRCVAVTPSFTHYAIIRQLSDDRITRESQSNSNKARTA